MKKISLPVLAVSLLMASLIGCAGTAPESTTSAPKLAPTSPPVEEYEIKKTPEGVKYIVDPEEIVGGGPPKDGIPSIDNPGFVSMEEADEWIEDNELRGVISDRDVLKASSPFVNTLAEHPRDVETLSKRAHQIMSREPITVTKDHGLEEAVHLLLKENVSCLPVLSPDGHIEGIVTWKDLIKAYVRKQTHTSIER